MFKKVFAASLAGLALASASQAAVLTYVLSLNDNGTGTAQGVAGGNRSFAVYGFTSAGDNSGIASFNFTVTGQSATVNRAPQATFQDELGVGDNKTSGFTLLRSTGGNNIATTGSFDTVSGNGLIVYGVGQRTGNLRTEAAPLAPAGYSASSPAAQGPFGMATSFTTGDTSSNASATTPFTTGGQVPVLLGSGTFADGTTPTLAFGLAALFNISQNGSSSIPTINGTTRNLVPEPASLAVLGLAGAGLVARRRKA